MPSSAVGRGAALGAASGAFALTLYFVAVMYFPGSVQGIIWGILAGTAAVLLGALLSTLVHGIFKMLAAKVTGVLIGAMAGFLIILAAFGYMVLLLGISALGVIPLCTGLGAAAAGVFSRRFRTATPARKLIALAALVLFIATGAAGSVWFAGRGNVNHLVEWELFPPALGEIDLPNPSEPGPYPVETLCYGSGKDLHRPEYGPETDIITQSVDVTPFVPQLSSFRTKLRERYWGFPLQESPINGRVWYPVGDGPFPLVMIVHGNHEMNDYSDTGYAYLGELLASRGYIVVSVDHNFLNFSRFAGDFGGGEVAGRAWLVLQHLSVWREWQEDSAHPFFGKVDMNNIGLIGHSRGGEAVAVAAALNKLTHYPDDAAITFDFAFAIKSVLAFAPSDEFYTPAGRSVPLEDVNYLVIHGGHDGDVAVFMGNRQYQRTGFSGAENYFKSALYVYQANHGQFNTGWGKVDMPFPMGNLLNLKALMPENEQRQIAKVYVSAFFEATLGKEQGYLPLFRDYRTGSAWLPKTLVLNRFQDSSFQPVSDFEEDLDPGTTTAAGGRLLGSGFSGWREGPLALRMESMKQANNVVYLDWNQEGNGCPSYEISLPDTIAEEWNLSSEHILSFSMVDLGQGDNILEDISVTLQTQDGASASLLLSEIHPITPPLRIRFTKLGFLEGMLVNPVEPVLQTYELPLAAFTEVQPGFNPAAINQITLKFGDSPRGTIALDDIGFLSPSK